MKSIKSAKKKINRILSCGLAAGLLFTATCEVTIADDSGIRNQDVRFWLAELERRNTGLPQAEPLAAPVTEPAGSAAVAPAKNTEKKGPKKISVDFYKVDLHNVFRLLGQVSGKNIVVDEGIKGTLTLALKDVPWTFVLEVIKNLKGLESIERYGTIMIYPASKKLTWAEDEAEGYAGTLEMDEAPAVSIGQVASAGSGFRVEEVRRSTTPLEDMEKAEKLMEKAARYEKNGRLQEALGLYKKAAELWPDNVDLLKKLASMCFKDNDYLNAYNYSRAAVKIAPEDAEALCLVAVSLASLNRNSEAKIYFEKALNTGKMDRDGMWNYAVFLFSQGNYRGALRLVSRMETIYPVVPEMILMKAQCYERLNKKRQAITEYQTVVSAGDKVPADLVEYAQLRLRQLSGGQDDKSN